MAIGAARSLYRSLLSTRRYPFVFPPEAIYKDTPGEWVPGFATYGQYNYLHSGLLPGIKRLHFSQALDLANSHAPNAIKVIDYGCADGVFLPTLSARYKDVAGIELRPEFCNIAEKCVRTANLTNARVFCNAQMSVEEERKALGGDFDVAFCLEVVEHAGVRESMWTSRVSFIKHLLSLLRPGGVAVVSVPAMLGIPFLIQRLALWGAGAQRDAISWKEMFDAGVLNKTDDLEATWSSEKHLGFNHLRLEEAFKGQVRVLERRHIFVQVLYALTSA
jgi:2-polyprenyl-3-methyl-5-hydroxy-6-metoxy-1,4-benzoquinol methylase